MRVSKVAANGTTLHVARWGTSDRVASGAGLAQGGTPVFVLLQARAGHLVPLEAPAEVADLIAGEVRVTRAAARNGRATMPYPSRDGAPPAGARACRGAMPTFRFCLTVAGALAAAAFTAVAPARAQTVTSAQFVNGLAIPSDTPDRSAGTDFDRRLGFFSDLYYDAARNEYWGVSDRGPGGGVLAYNTRVQRFTLDVDRATGRVGNFQVAQTIFFTSDGATLNGLAPSPASALGNAFDPEGFVVNPRTGTLLVSDEYGPSLVEFDRDGRQLRRFTTPDNLLPRNADGSLTFAGTNNVTGRTSNRGFEGLAVSPDGRFAYAVLQSGMANEGGGNGTYARLVKFDVATGQAVAQFAYPLDAATQGRGVSALVALGNDRFLVDERNNRGVGVGATLTPASKLVYPVDLSGATDISTVPLTGGVLPAGVVPVAKGAAVLDLGANTLAALGGFAPEKLEGLAVGPRLDDGRYLVLAGSDNDYCVTQNGSGT